jgi:hypothetical protein
MAKTYKDKLKSPKWQKRRLEIMERDGFQCQMCFDREETLTVHHKEYLKGLEPWEYEDKYLITLCEDCHESIHYWIEDYKKHPEKYMLFPFDNITDLRILVYRIIKVIELEGEENGIKTISQLLAAYSITIDEI